MHAFVLTACALIPLAANSILCRQALGAGGIDAASFTSIRIISGALMLVLIVLLRHRRLPKQAGSVKSAAMLFGYMVFFSFAYLSLDAGTGALILFGAVQLTMFAYALKTGEHFTIFSWLGLGLAIGGIIYLVSPGLNAPDLKGSLLMILAGVAWGLYSLAGRHMTKPLESTAINFIYCVIPVLCINLFFLDKMMLTRDGVLLAVASGALASGLGYTIWYAALFYLKATQAATVQLCVPILAAFGGIVILDEALTVRLVLASLATLGGVALVLMQRSKRI
jgi:drug/metabolite transporter (DMT)-like permease